MIVSPPIATRPGSFRTARAHSSRPASRAKWYGSPRMISSHATASAGSKSRTSIKRLTSRRGHIHHTGKVTVRRLVVLQQIRGLKGEPRDVGSSTRQNGPATGNGSARLRAPVHAGSAGGALGFPGAAGHPRVLSGGLEPGLFRPDGALPGDHARVQALRRGAHGHLRRRLLVPPRVREGSEPALPAARGL